MIHFEYNSGGCLIGSQVSFSFDYNQEQRKIENWNVKLFMFDPPNIPPIIPLKIIQRFCELDRIVSVLHFHMPEPTYWVLDGFHYSLKIILSDGRTKELSCGDNLKDLVPAIKLFERYAKRIRDLGKFRTIYAL